MSKSPPSLRAAAEARLAARSGQNDPAPARSKDQLLHELQVHQIELELQSEELKLAQAKTEEALERYSDFYDFSPVGFLTLTPDGGIARVNLAGARLLGMERSRLIDRRFSSFVADAQRQAFDGFLRRLFASEAGKIGELELVIDDRLPRPVQINAMLSPDRQECRAVVVDITEQKQVARALRESERRFRDVADISADWIWEVDMAGRYTYASESVRGLLGYAPEEIIGKTAFDLMPPDEAVRVREVFAAIAMRGESFRDLENIVLDSLGGRHDTLTSGTPILDATGKMIGYRGVDRNVTARKQTEQALRDMADGLEQKVAERTRQLRQLAAQLTIAEERERRKLAQDLHDNLTQLLAVIKIKLSSVKAGAAESSIDSLVALVGQAEEAVRNVTVELSPPILHTLGLVPALEWLGEEIERVYGLRVHVDHDHCRKHLLSEVQAVLYRSARELLINVAKHARVDEASVSCLCDDDRLLLQVSDTGCGFDPAAHTGPWFGHESFGLRSINERICNLGGEVDIDSSPGSGTTITLSVPCSTIEREICDDPRNACG